MINSIRLTTGLLVLGLISGSSVSAKSPSNANRKSTLTKLNEKAGITRKRGRVSVYHSANADREDVKFTQKLIAAALNHFANAPQIRKRLNVYAAILSKEDWEGLPIEEEVAPGMVIQVPFGMPGLTDRGPYGAILGASAPSDVDKDGIDDNVVTGANLEVLRRLPLANQEAILSAGFQSLDQAARRMQFLAAIHEMGHVYARELGIGYANHGSRIAEEMAASLFLYSFLKSRREYDQYVVLWDQILEGYVSTQCPTHKSVGVFDEVYFGVADPSAGGSILNFLFYQGMAQKLVRLGYSKYGLNFVQKLKEITRASVGESKPQALYARLSALDARFAAWLKSFDSPEGCSKQ